MDSVSQAALGAAIGVAVMGRRTAVWKAALWGAACGTLPDLDVIVDHGDAIRNMTLHRAESHSLFYLSLVSPVLAWVITRLQGDGAGFRPWWLATWLALVTHPLLDWLTVYGTQLGLPFTNFPFAVGSVFIIDPAFTLPLLIGLAATLAAARRGAGSGRRWNLLGLGLATAYLGWSVLAQQHVTAIAQASLRDQGVDRSALLVTPSPFNTVLWRVVATVDGDYLEGHYSLLDADRKIDFRRHPKGETLIEQHRDNWYVQRIAWFSQGFLRMRQDGAAVFLSDLRMGQEPSYTFTFAMPHSADGKPVLQSQRLDIPMALSWLWRRIGGERITYQSIKETR